MTDEHEEQPGHERPGHERPEALPGPSRPGGPVEDLSYTEASRELDDIVAFFEQRDVDVDQLVSKLERATAIVDELDRRLRRTRVQVEELVPRLQAAVADRPADQEGDQNVDGQEEPARRAPGEALPEDPAAPSGVATRRSGRAVPAATPELF